MKLNDLQNGQRVRARCGRAGPEDVVWGPWRVVELYVQRRSATQRGPEALCIVTLKNGAWAEYTPSDYEPHDNLFLTEDHYFQIEGLET